MRPIAEQSIEQMKLCASRLIITYYLRYTLVRCAVFTNTVAEAERITFYVLVTTCLLARKMPSLRHLSRLIDLMVDVVARDQGAGKRCTGQNRDTGCAAVLIEDQRMLNLIRAMNMLDGFARELMVLYHIESISVEKLSHLLGIPVAGIRVAIAAGQRKLAAYVNKLCPKPHRVRSWHVVLLLRELRYSLDGKCGVRLAACVLSYVAAWHKQEAPHSPCWSLN